MTMLCVNILACQCQITGKDIVVEVCSSVQLIQRTLNFPVLKLYIVTGSEQNFYYLLRVHPRVYNISLEKKVNFTRGKTTTKILG